MSLADDVKNELATITTGTLAAKKAQLATMIRFGGGLHLIKGHIVIEAQFSTLECATWLQNTIKEIYGYESYVIEVTHDAPTGGKLIRYSVRIIQAGGALALQSGLLDRRHRPVRGLPAEVISGSIAQVKAAWRGAFMAHGELSDPGKASYLEIVCPGSEAALALVNIAHRLGITVHGRKVRSSERVTLKDPDVIERMLTVIGATDTAREWSGKRSTGETRGKANRLANFDDANMRRSAKAAVEACEKVTYAFNVLGDKVPPNLRVAGQLRLDHRDASLEELGRMANPPITKDAIAGRIRRLFQMSKKYEAQQSKK